MNARRAIGLGTLVITLGAAPACDGDAGGGSPADSVTQALPGEPLSEPDPAGVRLLHTYSKSTAVELVSAIPVDADKLTGLLPAGYTVRSAADVGLGEPQQGLVLIANFRGEDPKIDDRARGRETQVAVDLGIFVNQPAGAAAAGVDMESAFQFYALAIYTDDAPYAASLRAADMPVEHIHDILYDRQMDDLSGIGKLRVRIRTNKPLLLSVNKGLEYATVGDALDAVFWYEGKRGTAVLHFHDIPLEQGNGKSKVFTPPGSMLEELISGGGLGPCAPDPVTGYPCVLSRAMNLRYRNGSTGRLLLLE